LRQRSGEIDCTYGELTKLQQTVEGPGGSLTTATTTLDYYNNGNLKYVVAPPNADNQAYQLDYQYDTDVNIYVSQVTNADFNYESTTTTDPRFGKPLCSADLNDNQIRYAYDEFARGTRIIGPKQLSGTLYKSQCPQSADGVTELAEDIYTIRFDYRPYVDFGQPQHDSWARTQHFDVDASGQAKGDPIETLLFIDGMKRVLQTKKDASVSAAPGSAPDPMMIVSGRVILDGLGRRIEQYYPTAEPKATNEAFNRAFDTVQPTTMSYDVLDRTLRTDLPDGGYTEQAYDIAPVEGINRFHTRITTLVRQEQGKRSINPI
jgi:hypothetical protein